MRRQAGAQASAPERPDRRALRTVSTGLYRVFGFGASMLLLAVASLMLVPALIEAGGSRTWGSIAVGQSLGSVAAVVVSLGWAVSGPAAIARADAATRRREFTEAVVAQLVASLPTLAAATTLAAVLGAPARGLAALAAASMALIGFTSNWYYVGTADPWRLFATETVPRVLGSLLGVVVLRRGADVAVGLVCQMLGIAVGVAVSWFVVHWSTRSAAGALDRRSLRSVLANQRHGVTTAVVSSAYGAAPVLIVSVVNPAALPVYALVDKLQRQVYVGATPLVAVFQGWVASAAPSAIRRRITAAHLAVLALVITAGTALVGLGDLLFGWLGANQVVVPATTIALTALWFALNLQESVASRVALVPLGRLDFVARATAIGTAAGLSAVAVLASVWGANGALIGICIGLGTRLTMCLFGARRSATPATEHRKWPLDDPPNEGVAI